LSAVVCVDVGSTYTKAAAVDLDSGRLLATGSHPTTLDTDVMDGLTAVTRSAGAGLDVAETLVCSSAGGGLRLGVIGNEPLVTARAAYRAGLSAGARVVGVCAGERVEDDLAARGAATPDGLLVAGGTDGGDATAVTANARLLADSGLRVPVVFAGNEDAAGTVATVLSGAGIAVTCVGNVLPRIGTLDPGPARAALREAFLLHVIAGKHLSRHERFVPLVRAATPDAVLAAVELLADRTGMALLVVDVGGATTDVYSALTPDPELEGPRSEVAGTAWRSRTVEGDLGVRHTATGIVEAAVAERIDTDPGLAAAAERRSGAPELAAGTERERDEDRRLTALAAAIAVRRHARGERIGGPTEPLRGGKDLAAVDVVIGSGGVLRHDPEVGASLLREAVCGQTDGGFRPPAHAGVVVDASYVLAPAGLLAAAGRTDTAERLLRTGLLDPDGLPRRR
jgi:uncharacterized protein (TIGR01319 family)